jgi:hypothetical protein
VFSRFVHLRLSAKALLLLCLNIFIYEAHMRKDFLLKERNDYEYVNGGKMFMMVVEKIEMGKKTFCRKKYNIWH